MVSKINIENINIVVGQSEPNSIISSLSNLDIFQGSLYINENDISCFILSDSGYWQKFFINQSNSANESTLSFESNGFTLNLNVFGLTSNINLNLPTVQPIPGSVLTAVSSTNLDWIPPISLEETIVDTVYIPPDINKTFLLDGVIRNFNIHSIQHTTNPIIIPDYVYDISFFDPTNQTLVSSYQNLNFSSFSDIANFIDINNPTSPTNTTLYATNINIKEITDPSIPKIEKFFGFNRFFTMLRGSKDRFYVSSEKRNYDTCYHCSLSNVSDILYNMFVYAHANNRFVQEDLTPSFFNNDINRTCVWVAREKNNSFYGIPKSGITIGPAYSFDSSNVLSRKFLDISTGNLVGITGTNYTYTLGIPRIAICFQNNSNPIINFFWFRGIETQNERDIIELNNPGSTSSWVQIDLSHNEGRIRRNFIGGAFSSAVLVYPVILDQNNDYIAVYIKPLGIDTLSINYVDTSDYAIEAVLFNSVINQRPRKKVNCNSFIMRSSPTTNNTVFPISSIFSSMSGETIYGTTQGSTIKYPKIHFRLRNLSNNRVGKLSSSYVTGDFSGRNAPFRLWLSSDA